MTTALIILSVVFAIISGISKAVMDLIAWGVFFALIAIAATISVIILN